MVRPLRQQLGRSTSPCATCSAKDSTAGRKSCRRGAADLDVGAQLLLKRETVTAGDFPAIRSVKVATEPPRFGAGVKRVHRVSAGALRPGASIGGICLQRYGAAPDRGRPMVCPWQIFNNKSSPATIELNQKRKRSQSYPVMGAIAGLGGRGGIRIGIK